MSVGLRTKALTFEEFCFLVKDGQKADLIDGVIYMASPENTDANELFVWLIGLVNLFVQAKELGKVFGSRVALRLDLRNGPEPDIAFVKRERLRQVKRGHIAGPADAAMEIVSPDSIERDYVKKRRQYQRAGVTEYWIIDEMRQRVTLLRLDGTGKYRVLRPIKGELHSQVISGFWLRTDWLWQKTLPKLLNVFQEVLAGQNSR